VPVMLPEPRTPGRGTRRRDARVVLRLAGRQASGRSSAEPSVFGQPVTFTAVVSPAQPGTPTGTVTFLDGGSPIGSGTLTVVGGVDRATLTTPALAVGSHTITATYGGNSSFNASNNNGNPLTQVVNKANTTTSVTSSMNPSRFNQPVTFAAAVLPVQPGAGTPGGSVTFLDGGVPIGMGTLNGGVATFTASALAPGSHTITTSFPGNGNFNGGSGSLTGNPQLVEDFSIAVTPGSETLPPGLPALYLVTVSSTSNFTGPINLTCSGGPQNSKCKVVPSTVTLTSGPQMALVIVDVGFSKSAGTSDLTVTGTSGATTHSTAVSIKVK